MRKQYHLRPGLGGLLAWDIDRLIELSKELPVFQLPLSDIDDLDRPYWYDHGYVPTCRSVAEHARLINAADLSFPIILSAEGDVMDGMHRVAKAVLEGRSSIAARQFFVDPEPDFVGIDPGDLPYSKSN